jgi:penicillin-binding protein 1A
MAKDFTAGERLARDSDPDAARRPPPPGADPRPPREPRRRRVRREGPFAVLGRLVSVALGVLTVAAVVGLIALYGAYRHYAAGLPDVDGLKSYQPRVMSRVFAADGRLMAELATERRIFVPYTAIPERVRQAFVSAEDQHFWIHRGVDPLAILRAGLFNLMHSGRRPIGASTITQQVAKNMLLDPSLSYQRKIKEVILALRIEQSLTKERILELYLNEIYLGLQSYGVAAAAQAYFNKPLDELSLSEAAFLATLPKAPNNYNPFRFPDAARERRDWVLDRMADDHDITLAEAAVAKQEPIIPAQLHRPEPVAGADWFAEEVRRRLVDRFGADTTTTGGLMVRTSMDPVLQAHAERTLRAGLLAYDRKLGGWRGPVGHLQAGFDEVRRNWPTLLAQQPHPPGMLADWRLAVVTSTAENEAHVGWLEPGANGQKTQAQGVVLLSDLAWARPVHNGTMGGSPRRITEVMQSGDLVMIEPGSAAQPVGRGAFRADRVQLRQVPAVQGALVSLDPTTGRVLALVGGWSFEQSQFNRATQAIRQPGSSFKPIVYLTALEQGISPSQVYMDTPLVVGDWRPQDDDGKFLGPISMHTGLQYSRNLVAIRIAQQVGMPAVAQTAAAFHVVDDMPKVLPAAIGAVGTTVLRMAGAYAGFATGGREVVPSLIDSVQDHDGHVVQRAPGRSCEACGDPSAPPSLTDDRAQIADPPSVFQLVTMMQAVVLHGTGIEAGKGLNRPIAGKTGTTQDMNDAWFVGFTPDIVTAVWVGFDTPTSLGSHEYGGTLAAPIWHDYMAFALRDHPVLQFPVPEGITVATWGSGNIDAFKEGQVPGQSGPVAGQTASSDTGADASTHGGVDTSMGGLY